MCTAVCVHAVLPDMLARPSQSFSIIVPMSPVAFYPWPAATMYATNRWALRGFLMALGQDLHWSNVKVVQALSRRSFTLLSVVALPTQTSPAPLDPPRRPPASSPSSSLAVAAAPRGRL